MKRHLAISTSVLMALAVLSVSVAPASFAAIPKPKATAKAQVKPPAKSKVSLPPIKKPVPRAEKTQGGTRFASLTLAQRGCLIKQGITISVNRSSTAPRPTPNPTGATSGIGGARGNFDPTKLAAAYKACKITMPAGGFARGGFGAFNSPKFQAFQKCMVSAGMTPTGGFGRYDESDPSTVAVLVKCQKSSGFTLPKPGQPGLKN
jgi:hypothetical protein